MNKYENTLQSIREKMEGDGLYIIDPLDNYKIVNKISHNDGFENSIAFNPKNNYIYMTNSANKFFELE